MKPRIVIAGGNGFLGRALVNNFKRDFEIVVLTRSPHDRDDNVQEIAWDTEHLDEWTAQLEGARAVINLNGRSVDCRYNEKNRRAIILSRINPTRILGQAIADCASPPPIWLNASSATYYKHSFDKPNDENGEVGATAEAKDAFSIEVIRQWENAFNQAVTPKTRKVALRATVVLGKNGGAFPAFRQLAQCGLGGALGSGRQMFSWIHEEDFCRAIDWIIKNENLAGVINVAAPGPLPNHEVMRLIRQAVGAPFGLPAAQWMLEIGAFFLRTETELLIKSRYVVPGKLKASGFEFHFPELNEALADLCK